MSYVDRVLQPGEEVRYRASLHWIAYVPGLALHLLAGLLWIAAPDAEPWRSILLVLAGLSAAAALILIAQAWFKCVDHGDRHHRPAHHLQDGLRPSSTNEMNMDKVESVQRRPVHSRAHARLWPCEHPGHRRRLRDAQEGCRADRTAQSGHRRVNAAMAASPRQLGKSSRIPASPVGGGARPRAQSASRIQIT